MNAPEQQTTQRAIRSDVVTWLVGNFREHCAVHGGDTACAESALGQVFGTAKLSWTGGLLASAIARIAEVESELADLRTQGSRR